jgi:ORF6N domain
MQVQQIQNKIYTNRALRVMLDNDLAELYDLETRVLNQAVKHNIRRFPMDFMFQLTHSEWNEMSSQFVMKSANIRPKKSSTYAFTEQGLAILSGVLKSDLKNKNESKQ